MPSSTLPGVPLSVLISNIKKQANSVRMSLEIGQVLYEHEYVQKGFSLHEKIICMVRKLQLVDKKVCNFRFIIIQIYTQNLKTKIY